MERYLNTVEEVIKALKDDIIHDSYDGSFYKIVDGNICHFFKSGLQIINSGISIRETEINKYYTEEPEPLKFEVNRAYKTRGGYKAFLNSKTINSMIFLCVEAIGNKLTTNLDGKYSNNADTLLDVIGYWEE